MIVPLITGVLCLAFAALLVGRFAGRRRPYHAVWALALLCFGVSTLAEAWGGAEGWSSTVYRWWYVCGAICLAALLGMGSLYLHAGQRLMQWSVVGFILVGCVPAAVSGYVVEAVVGVIGAALLLLVHLRRREQFAAVTLVILLVAIALAAARVLTSTIDPSLLPAQGEIATGQAFGDDVRILTPMFNIPGAAVLLLGAVLSAIHWRMQTARFAANVLIALGAFVPSLASGLLRFGDSSVFYSGQLVSVVCLAGGFALSELTSARPRLRPAASSGPSSDSRARAT